MSSGQKSPETYDSRNCDVERRQKNWYLKLIHFQTILFARYLTPRLGGKKKIYIKIAVICFGFCNCPVFIKPWENMARTKKNVTATYRN